MQTDDNFFDLGEQNEIDLFSKKVQTIHLDKRNYPHLKMQKFEHPIPAPVKSSAQQTGQTEALSAELSFDFNTVRCANSNPGASLTKALSLIAGRQKKLSKK